MTLSIRHKVFALASCAALLAIFPMAISPAKACPLGDCDGSHLTLTRAGEEGSPTRDPNEIIMLPTKSREPYMLQHGPTRRGDIIQFPVEYERRENEFVGFFISFPELRSSSNPRGWFTSYGDFPNRGWSVFDPIMQQCLDMGINEVWFWNWSGQHSVQPPRPIKSVMPWFIPEGHTPAMRESWPQFVRKWKDRGMRFGVWVGGTYIPNHGTLDNPDFRFLTRDDFDYVADTFVRAKDYGFDIIGMDAVTSLFRYRDVAPGARNRPHPVAGVRDPGIVQAFLEHLRNDSRLDDVYLCAELMLPPGPHAAIMPSLCSIAPREQARQTMPNIDSVESLVPYEEINPGHEQIALITSGPWSSRNRAEFEQLRAKLRDMGYRVGYTQGVLRGLGMLEW
jgi:hypothetical protein